MRIALTVRDFLRPAQLVYGDRVGLIDEPDQPAASWGSVTYGERRLAPVELTLREPQDVYLLPFAPRAAGQTFTFVITLAP